MNLKMAHKNIHEFENGSRKNVHEFEKSSQKNVHEFKENVGEFKMS